MNSNLFKMRQEDTRMMRQTYPAFVLLLSSLLWGMGVTPGYGVPLAEPQEQAEAREHIHQSVLATEHAWEEFHQAAIGGTLASPAVQSRIEHQLHEVRALLMKARTAERTAQYGSVKSLTQSILKITQDIVHASQEQKP